MSFLAIRGAFEDRLNSVGRLTANQTLNLPNNLAFSGFRTEKQDPRRKRQRATRESSKGVYRRPKMPRDVPLYADSIH
jgi:hypothetical protein